MKVLPTLAVSGATGRMGRAVLELAEQDEEFQVKAALENEFHPSIGKLLHAVVPILKKSSVVIKGNPIKALHGVDVLIDFTQPEATLGYIDAAMKTRTGMVIGTTGFSKLELKKISNAAKKIPIVQSYNMSVGMNVLFMAVEMVARSLGSAYDVEIIEVHHNQKKDAPSGTAIRLGEGVIKGWGVRYPLFQYAVHGRVGKVGARKRGVIGYHAVRGGDIVGDHTVLFAGPGERLELTHRAHSRYALAQGALKAAHFIVGKKNGLYDMWDVLGLRSTPK
jgi:4-hydroxy-tetrahydrodipicolinate reductase